MPATFRRAGVAIFVVAVLPLAVAAQSLTAAEAILRIQQRYSTTLRPARLIPSRQAILQPRLRESPPPSSIPWMFYEKLPAAAPIS